MKRTADLLLAVLLALGSLSANAGIINGSVPGCIDTGGPTPETFCNSSFNASLNTANGFNFTVMFDNQSFVETLLVGFMEVDLFFSPTDFPFSQVLTINSFSLKDSAGNNLPIAFPTGAQLLGGGDLRFTAANVVGTGNFIHGFDVSLSCDDVDTGFVGACASGLTFGNSAIAMSTLPNQSSLRVGRATVPEPTTVALMGLGLAGIGFARRRA